MHDGDRPEIGLARAEMIEHIDAARRTLEPHRLRLRMTGRLDAAEWSRMSVALAELEKRFGELVWDARLAALLEKI